MPVTTYTVVNGEVLSENRNGVKRDYVPDSLGNTVALLDNTQTKTDTWSYWPYGEVRARTGTTATPYGYCGTLGCRTQADGGIYMRARVQEPEHGRFATVDPLWPWEDPFRYVGSSPTVYADPSGLFIAIPGFEHCGPQIKPGGKPRGPSTSAVSPMIGVGHYCLRRAMR